ncbi:autophagy protein 6 [Rhizophlyctis rosea]|uniref:Autophagy protein 6 n=1 Tax=Rhizophlyctis rosea TaxID=64517 RepID=A0AAD5SFU6_9FUNG|nr:autophagy protein 6 [Rhizophlyctis rosea]
MGPMTKRTTVPIHDSFVMLSRSQVAVLPPSSQQSIPGGKATQKDDQQKGSLSHRLKIAGKLFDLISGVSDVDHPLCQDCADELVMKLEKRLGELKKEKESYAAYLSQLQSEASENDGADSAAELAALKEKEQNSLNILKDLEKEKSALADELLAVESEMKELEEAELRQVCTNFSPLGSQLLVLTTRDSVNLKFQNATAQLEKLKKTNVYNDTFRIWHDGPFGTINGFRMGRLPNQPVEWSEINAAMGQALLLLDTLGNKLNFTFKTYRVVPMGSFSRIEKTEGDKATYELYGSGDLKGMLFWNRRFDNALVAFLDCLKQLGDYAEQQDSKFRINKEKIGEVSIKLQFNQDESWTRALKYTLINLKWILAFCCSKVPARASVGGSS